MSQSTAAIHQSASLNALVIDDDPDFGALYRAQLSRYGFGVECATTLEEGLQLLAMRRFHALILDLMLGDESTLSHIPKLLKAAPHCQLFVLTAYASIDLAIQAMRLGATGFYVKTENPSKITKEIKASVLRAHPQTALTSENSDSETYGLIGQSKAISEIIHSISLMKDVDSTILITGESGTGKELIARALHRASVRKEYPFSAINCGAIPENLLESELFGYRKGAFTDARTDHKGIFEVCSQGTILLDEIGDMSPCLQVKLLRVIQEHEVRPVGSTATIPISTRVIASTHRNLEDEVKAGRFREDLYYRLTVLRIYAPPLRSRPEDIPLLVEYFVNRITTRFNKRVQPISRETMLRLKTYDWPGNVRELTNSVERAIVLAPEGGELSPYHLFAHYSDDEPHPETSSPSPSETGVILPYKEAKEEFERNYFQRLLKTTSGNISEASRLAATHRPKLYRILQKYHIDPSAHK